MWWTGVDGCNNYGATIPVLDMATGIAYDPDFGMAHAALGGYYLGKNSPDQALPYLVRAVDLVPELSEVRLELADLFVSRNDPARAVVLLREGLRRDPDSSSFANNLAWLLATSSNASIRDGAEAVRLAEQVVNRDMAPDRPVLSSDEQAARLDTLAGAYAEAGRYDDAIKVIHRAIDAAKNANQSAIVGELEVRARLYEQHQPYHQ